MKRMIEGTFRVATAACVLALPAIASAAITAADHADVKFVAVGPAGLRIVGESTSLRLTDDAQFLTVSVPLDALATGIGLRDHHMKEKYLEVAKYPNATLKVERKALQLPAPGAKTSRDAQGELTLHGKTKRITFHYDAEAAGSGFTVSAALKVNMTDFGIEAPSYLGMSVKPEVAIDVHFHASGN